MLLCACVPGAADAQIARFNTSLGIIEVRLYPGVAPLSVQNFSNYATSGRYTDTFIHRVPQLPTGGTANFVVQGGGFKLNNSIFAAAGIQTDPPIGNEFKISNTRGTLSFAKNSLGATSQWFFNIGNNSALDADNFTVFGRVIGGMNVVDAINNLQIVNAQGAENAAGEDFDEVPVINRAKVLAQNDIFNADAVMIHSIQIRNLPAGDYNFDGTVNMADYSVLRATYGSVTDAWADGNGNGVVDAADYAVWRNTFGQTTSGAASVVGTVPEPSAAVLLLLGIWPLSRYRRRRGQ